MVDKKSVRTVDVSWSPEVIKKFCETKDNWILALDPKMTAEELRVLYVRQRGAKEFYMGMIAEIAEHPHSPSDILHEIADSYLEDIEVRRSLSLNPNLPPDIREKYELWSQSCCSPEWTKKYLKLKRGKGTR